MTADDPLDAFRARRAAVRDEMGGAGRVAAIRAGGGRTVRDRIGAFCDPGTFVEQGTFARSARAEDAATTPGDGKVGGHGRVDGQWVTVAGDDVTVKRGSSSVVGSRRLHALYRHALRAGQPFVYFGETGGARIPDTLGSEGFVSVPPSVEISRRARRIPLVTVIVGPSFGGSSFLAAQSDLVVQVRGTCLAVTSPRVIEIATGEQISMEDLGGVDVHATVTGQVDVAVETEDEAYAVVRRFLALVPRSAAVAARRAPVASAPEPDPGLVALVPTRRRRAYDMRRVLGRLVDAGDLLELGPRFGPGLVCALARIDGHAVGVVASQPIAKAGSLGPDEVEKATRLVCLCDAWDLPLVFVQDVPGFFVGRQVEHDRLLAKAIRFQDALAHAGCPTLTVVLRKAFGLGFFALGGTGVDLVYAWPGAEIGFMDPEVAANVVGGDADQLAAETDVYGAAGIMGVDEVIDPADTRIVLAAALDRLAGRRLRPHAERVLATWPTC